MRYRLMATYRGVPYEVGMGPSNSELVLFAACPPPEELGFEPATGHWRKPVIRAEIDGLWESRPVGMFRGEPCIVLDDPGDRLHIAYLGTDAGRATSLGYWQVDRGVFELLTPREEVTELTEERVEKPLRWGELAEATGPMATYPYGTAPWPTAAPRMSAPQSPPDEASAEEAVPGADGLLDEAPIDDAPLDDAPLDDAGTAEMPSAEVPPTEVLSAGLPSAEVPLNGAPAAGVPPADAPGAGLPPARVPVKAPVSDTPLADALLAETLRAGRNAGALRTSAPLADDPLANRPADNPLATATPADDPMTGRPADVTPASTTPADDPTADSPLASAMLADGQMTDRVADTPLADNPMTDRLADTPLADVPLAAPLADDPAGGRPAGTPLASVPLASVSPETVAPAAVPVPSAVSAADDGAPTATGGWPAYPGPGTDPYPDPFPAGDSLSYPGEDDPADLQVPPGFYDPPAPGDELADVEPVGDIGGRAARRQRVPTREIFCELADLASIPRAAYALETETDGAICLLPTPDGFEVFIAADGARHELRSFAEEEAAYFYLFGVLAADAVRSGALAPTVTMANPHGGAV